MTILADSLLKRLMNDTKQSDKNDLLVNKLSGGAQSLIQTDLKTLVILNYVVFDFYQLIN